ncbi:MAG: hypothetical protein V4598_07635 [Bdellovibrionota bacterium]
MIGLLVIALTVVMIVTLVRNALVGKQLTADENFPGTIELLIPITTRSEFYIEPWMAALETLGDLKGRLKIRILIDGHHPAMTAWNELSRKLPFVELHSFINRPVGVFVVPWMLKEISSKVTSDVVIIGDAELVPSEAAFSSLSHYVTQKERAYFVLPQTVRGNILGESVALLNPTLALASVFGFRRFRNNISHPMMSIAQGWLGMPASMFREIDFGKIRVASWKQGLAEFFDMNHKFFGLAYGEKHLRRYYPEDLKVQIFQMKTYWDELWMSGDRAGFWLFVACLFIWVFPVLFFFTHPFQAIGSIMLLSLYRFFSKIVFQESWRGIALHLFGAIVWAGTLVWWVFTSVKDRYGFRARSQY